MRTGAQIRRLLIVAIITTMQAVIPPDPAEARGKEQEDLLLDYDRITRNPELMRELADMFVISESTPLQIEIAAFLVRKPGNRLSVVRWPSNGHKRTETWRGPIPRGTIAVIHTHPNGWMKPSSADHQESTRIGIPFIVLTRSQIWVAEPNRRHAVAVLRGVDWSDETYLLALEAKEPVPDRQIRVATSSPNEATPAGEIRVARPTAPMP